MDVKIIVEFAVAALIAIGILVGILIGIQADMCKRLYEVLDENISIRKIMFKHYVAMKLLLKNSSNIDVDEFYDIYKDSVETENFVDNVKDKEKT